MEKLSIEERQKKLREELEKLKDSIGKAPWNTHKNLNEEKDELKKIKSEKEIDKEKKIDVKDSLEKVNNDEIKESTNNNEVITIEEKFEEIEETRGNHELENENIEPKNKEDESKQIESNIELLKQKEKSEIEVKLSDVEDLFQEKFISSDERTKMRNKILGID